MESQSLHGAYSHQEVLPDEPELIRCLYESLQHQAGFHDFLAMLTTAINGCAAQLSFIRKASSIPPCRYWRMALPATIMIGGSQIRACLIRRGWWLMHQTPTLYCLPFNVLSLKAPMYRGSLKP